MIGTPKRDPNLENYPYVELVAHLPAALLLSVLLQQQLLWPRTLQRL